MSYESCEIEIFVRIDNLFKILKKYKFELL